MSSDDSQEIIQNAPTGAVQEARISIGGAERKGLRRRSGSAVQGNAPMRSGSDVKESTQLLDQKDVESNKPTEGASVIGTILNLTKNICGAGMLMLPEALMQAHFAYGVGLLIGCACFFAFTFYIIGESCYLTGVDSITELWEVSLGKKTGWILDLTIWFSGLITVTMYIINVNKFVNLGLSGLGFVQPMGEDNYYELMYTGIFGMGIIFPLCLITDMSKFKTTSLMGIGCTVFALVFVVKEFAMAGSQGFDNLAKDAFGTPDMQFMTAACCFSSAFACHYNAAKFYSGLKDKCPATFKKVVVGGFGASCFIFGLFSICAYGVFGPIVYDENNKAIGGLRMSNVLENWDATSGVFCLSAWVLMGFCVLFGAPLVYNTAAQSWFNLCLKVMPDLTYSKGEGMNRKATTFVFILSASVATTALGAAIGPVNSFKGAMCSNQLCLTIPALLYLKVGDARAKWNPAMHEPITDKPMWKIVLAYCAIVWGLTTTSVGLYKLIS